MQLVPAGIMAFGLLTVRESPRWLASKGRVDDALTNLAYLRKRDTDDEEVRAEMAEIEAAIEEEREARKGLGVREAFFGKGNFIRFVIAVVIFILQQWGGQNSVNYYAPQIFTSVSVLDSSLSFALQRMWANMFVVDRVHRHGEFVARVGHLRHRQGRCDGTFRVLPRRLAGTQDVALHLVDGHGHPLLHHRRSPQDPSAAHECRDAAPSEQGDGGDAVPLRVLLQHGLGPASVGIRLGHLPDAHTALRLGDCFGFAVALQ